MILRICGTFNWENFSPTVKTLEKLAAALNSKPSEILSVAESL